MLKASALTYALFVMVIVALLCGSLVLVFTYQHRMNLVYFSKQDLITTSNNHFLRLLNDFKYNEIGANGILESEDQRFKTTYSISKWGLFDKISMNTYTKNDSIGKAALFGARASKDQLALYLSDLDKPLYVGGTTQINGNVKLSKYGVKIAYLNNHNYTGKRLVYGKIGTSKRTLPSLNIKLDSTEFHALEHVYVEELRDKKIDVNSFLNPTKVVIQRGTILDNISLKGNFILISKDSLYVKNNVQLNDIIIKAPSVVFEKGFKGSLQVIAKNHVALKEEVILEYPSSIYVENDRYEDTTVTLEKHSKLCGAVVLTGNEYKYSLARILTLNEKATLMGVAYCYGKTQIKGKIIGSLYTDRLVYKNETAIYENYLVNVTIDRKNLPKYFIAPKLFDMKNQSYALIKEL